ncbi:MAG: sulfurtransferase TusA family protein [Actinomycetales bacterium]
MSTPSDSVVEVDARGLRCPLPVIEAAKRSRSLAVGTRLRVLSTDPATAYDLPAWARMRGHRVQGVQNNDGLVVVEVVLGGSPA